MKRSRGKNPYPGVSRATDRHGKIRWRFRKAGLPDCYLAGEYGSADFIAAYEAALLSKPKPRPNYSKAKLGTFAWLIEEYLKTPSYLDLAPTTRKDLRREFDKIKKEHGKRMIKELRPKHVEKLMGNLSTTPAMANKFLKHMKMLCRFALKRQIIAVDPTFGIRRFRGNPDGFHTWTDDEVTTFEKSHGPKSKAILAMRLALFTGAARQDLIGLGWQNIRDGRLAYRRGKTGGQVNLPIIPQLHEVLQYVPEQQMLFLTTESGVPFTTAGFGNWWRKQVLAAGLNNCPIHGLRKAGATRLANAGATEFEIMAFLGHSNPREAATYTAKANRSQLADSAMSKLVNSSNSNNMLDKSKIK